MGQKRSPDQLAKLLTYILGRRPDEFGLVTDENGYVKIPDLLKAVTEEQGWGYVRRSHLNEVMITLPDPFIEIDGNMIRAIDRQLLSIPEYDPIPPKLLYTCVRKRAHAVVLENGVLPGGYPQVVLASDRDMAERMGRRIDGAPVLITVQVQKSMGRGVRFFRAGETLYLADAIPAGCFSAPPLPKEKETPQPARKPEKPAKQPTPGSFFPDMDQLTSTGKLSKRDKKKKDIARSKQKKQQRRQKQEKMWEP